MQPAIYHYPHLTIAGFSFTGDPFHSHAGWTEANEIGRLWKRLSYFLAQPGCPCSYPAQSYEIFLQNHETPQTGEFEVFVGFEVSDLQHVPLELCVKVLPEADYALFVLRGAQIQMDEPLVAGWLAAAGYRQTLPVFIQRYDRRFKGLDHLEDSELDLLVPVTRLEPEPDDPA